MIYFMRGSLSMSEMYNLTPYEREIIDEFLGERFEIEKTKPPEARIY